MLNQVRLDFLYVLSSKNALFPFLDDSYSFFLNNFHSFDLRRAFDTAKPRFLFFNLSPFGRQGITQKICLI